MIEKKTLSQDLKKMNLKLQKIEYLYSEGKKDAEFKFKMFKMKLNDENSIIFKSINESIPSLISADAS